MYNQQQRSPHSMGPQVKVPGGQPGQSTSRYSDYSPMQSNMNTSMAGKYNYDYGVGGSNPSQGFNTNLIAAQGLSSGEQMQLQNEHQMKFNAAQAYGATGQRFNPNDLSSQQPLSLQNQNRLRDAISTESLRMQRHPQGAAGLLQKDMNNLASFGQPSGTLPSLGPNLPNQISGQQNPSSGAFSVLGQIGQNQQPINLTNLGGNQNSQNLAALLQQIQNQNQSHQTNDINSINPQNPQIMQMLMQQQQLQLMSQMLTSSMSGQNPQSVQQRQSVNPVAQSVDVNKLLLASQQPSTINPQLQQLLQLQQQQQVPQAQNPLSQLLIQQMLLQNQQTPNQQQNPTTQAQAVNISQALLQLQQQQQQQTLLQAQSHKQGDSHPNTGASVLPTPMDTSRLLQQQQPSQQIGPNNLLQSAGPGGSAQHQQFVQQYQQLNETMNQYRKLASLIGQQENQKKEQLILQQQQQQQQQQQLQLQQQQQQLLLQQQLQQKAKSQAVNVQHQQQQQQAQTLQNQNQADLINSSILDNSRFIQSDMDMDRQLKQLQQQQQQRPASSFDITQLQQQNTRNVFQNHKQSVDNVQNTQVSWPSANAQQTNKTNSNNNNTSDIISNHEKSFASPQSQAQPTSPLIAPQQQQQKNLVNNQNADQKKSQKDFSSSQDSQLTSTTPHSQSQQVPLNINTHRDDLDNENKLQDGSRNQSILPHQHQQSYVSELEYDTKFIEGDYNEISSARQHLLNTFNQKFIPEGLTTPQNNNPHHQTFQFQQLQQQIANLSPDQKQMLLNQSLMGNDNNNLRFSQTLDPLETQMAINGVESQQQQQQHQFASVMDEGIYPEGSGAQIASQTQLSAGGKLMNQYDDDQQQFLRSSDNSENQQRRSEDQRGREEEDFEDNDLDKNEKPISQQKMTFEELLESKLQQEQESQEFSAQQQSANKSTSKREFLRKNSSNKSAILDQSRSNHKSYKYYTDNFTNSSQNNNQSPRSTYNQPQAQTTQIQNSHIKKTITQTPNTAHSKSNQKQPKQNLRSSPRQVGNTHGINRPNSQQHVYEPRFNNKNEENQPLRTTMSKQKQQQSVANLNDLSQSQDNSHQPLKSTHNPKTSGSFIGSNPMTSNNLQQLANNNTLGCDQSMISLSQQSVLNQTQMSENKAANNNGDGNKKRASNAKKTNQPHTSKANNSLNQTRNKDFNIGHSNNLNIKTADVIALKEDQQIILSDRNSVAEFEQLEQECIAKYLQNQSMQIFPDGGNLGANDDDYYIESQSVRESMPTSQKLRSSTIIKDSKHTTNKKKTKSPKVGKSYKKPSELSTPKKKQQNQAQEQQQKPMMTILATGSNSQSLNATSETPRSNKINQGSPHSHSHINANGFNEEQQKKLDQKLLELEFEIQRFKQEKSKVQSLQQEYEEQLERVTREIEDFENRKELEVEEIQAWKQTQMQEIEQEKINLETQKLEIMQEKEKLSQLRDAIELEREQEDEKLMYQIKCLEEDNERLNEKVREYYEKDLSDIGVQTIQTQVNDAEVITDITGDIKNVRNSQSQALSPIRGILKNTATSPRPQEQPNLIIDSKTAENSIRLSAPQFDRMIRSHLHHSTKPKNISIQADDDELIPKSQQILQTSFELDPKPELVDNFSQVQDELVQSARIHGQIIQDQIVKQISQLREEEGVSSYKNQASDASGFSQYQKRIESQDSPQIYEDEDTTKKNNQNEENCFKSNVTSQDAAGQIIFDIEIKRELSTNSQVPVQNQHLRLQESQQKNLQQPQEQAQKHVPSLEKKLYGNNGSPSSHSNKSTNRQNDNSSFKQSNQQVYQVKKQGVPSSHSQQRVVNNVSQSNLLSQRSTSQQPNNIVSQQPTSRASQNQLNQPMISNVRSQTQQDKKPEQDKDFKLQQATLPSNRTNNKDQDLEDGEDSEEDEFDLKFPPEYHGKHLKAPALLEEVTSHDGKKQRFYDNGKKEVIFSNGVRREVWPTGYSVVYFTNNDVKQTFPDQKVVYYFAEAKTTQTTFPNGLQVFKFSNNQIEKHFQDGTKEISFPDGTIKCLFPDGEEESIFPDGTIQKIEKTGVRIIEFPNGQRDVLYPDGTKVREFEDGSIKKIHPDGRIEIIQSKKKGAVAPPNMTTQPKNLNKYMNQPRKK